MSTAIYNNEVRNVETRYTGDDMELKLVISEADLEYIKGMKLDPTDDGVMTRVFRSVQNAASDAKRVKTSDNKE
jgi:hypothetical protein